MTEIPADLLADEVPVARPSDYVSDRKFADFPISPTTLRGLQEMKYVSATPVQSATIEPALAGRDLIVRAKTGTGKTCAFGVPLVERADEGARVTLGLVLTPTRELAVQVAQEVAAIAAFRDLRITAIYGGVGFPPQEDALRAGSEIVVGTPGRLLDHLRRGNLKLDQLRLAVLDEADEMLSMGFLEDVKKILDKASSTRQTMLFSATLDESLRGFARSHMKNPEDIHLSHDGENVELITHILYETSPDYHKARALLDLIEQERPRSAIIFCNTREDVATVYSYLDRQGLGVEMLSGELHQKQRERVMARVKGGGVQFLVSTDVAARGIDISDLSHVIHYSLPEDPSVYLHRSGRTGRIGKEGTAIALSGGADFSTRITLVKQHKINFEIKLLPTAEQSAQLRTDRFARMLKDASGTMAFESYLDVVRAIKQRPDSDTLLAVALRAFLDWDRKRRNADTEPPAGETFDPASGGRQEGRPPQRSDGPRRDESRGRDDNRGREERPRDDRPRSDRPRDDRPRDDRPRDDRPRDDRPRDESRPRDDRPRDANRGRDERPRADRPREDRPREDRPRDATRARTPRSSEARPPEVGPPEASPEAEQGWDNRPRSEADRGGDAVRPPDAPAPAARHDQAPPAPDIEGDEIDEESGGEGSESAADGTKKRRRRRRRRPAGETPAATPAASE